MALLFAFPFLYFRRINRRAGFEELVVMQKSVAGLTPEALARFVCLASRTVRLRGSANVLVTGNRAMQILNARFRNQDEPTDVLSFPAPAEVGFAGDIAISADLAKQNGCQLGHSAAQEIKILALHGLLHLAGFDHEQDNGEMARREHRARKMLGLPMGLIERKGLPTARNNAHGRRRVSRQRNLGRARQ